MGLKDSASGVEEVEEELQAAAVSKDILFTKRTTNLFLHSSAKQVSNFFFN